MIILSKIADELDSTLTSETQLEIQEEEEEEEEDEEDIETLIAKELNQIKSKVPHQSLAHRFNSKPMDCECCESLSFISLHKLLYTLQVQINLEYMMTDF